MNKEYRKERVAVPGEAEAKFGRVTDAQMSKILNCSLKTARQKRISRGIPAKRKRHSWSRIEDEVYANVPVPTISKRFGISQRQIYNYLRRNSIEFTRLRETRIPYPTVEQIRIIKQLGEVPAIRKAEVLGVDIKWIRKWNRLYRSSEK